jgi:hypothetical protein
VLPPTAKAVTVGVLRASDHALSTQDTAEANAFYSLPLDNTDVTIPTELSPNWDSPMIDDSPLHDTALSKCILDDGDNPLDANNETDVFMAVFLGIASDKTLRSQQTRSSPSNRSWVTRLRVTMPRTGLKTPRQFASRFFLVMADHITLSAGTSTCRQPLHTTIFAGGSQC